MKNWIKNKIYTFFSTYTYVFLIFIYFILFLTLDWILETKFLFKLNIGFLVIILSCYFYVFFLQIFYSWENFLLWSDNFFVWFIYFGLFIYFAYFFSLFIYFVWVSICSIEIIEVEVLPSSDFLMQRTGVRGILYGDVVNESKWYYGIPPKKFSLYHNDNFFYSKGIIRKNLYLEAISKVNHHRIYEELNVLDKQSIKLLFPLENSNFKGYVPKGGDLILEKDKEDVVVIELKNRISEFNTKKTIKWYANDFVKTYDKNMIIAVECNTSSIANDLMNYTKELKGKEFCFDKADLQKPEVIMELQSLSMKSNFKSMVIMDASHYHNPATETDLAFAKSTMEEFKQYTPENIVEFKQNLNLDIVECFENPTRKVNADLEKNLYIYKNFYYGRSEK